MIRRIIHIDEELCNGCGLCASACHEGAIGMVNGKAKLLRDDYCDGLGDCLPACPTGAITFVEREAAPYDEAAVIAAQMAKAKAESHASMPTFGCPGSQARALKREGAVPAQAALASEQVGSGEAGSATGETTATGGPTAAQVPSQLGQWPVQIKLVPVGAPYFNGCDLLVAADCTAFAYGNFHEDFMKDRVCVVGCPKLDGVDYAEKLGAILRENDVRSVTVARMEVPCCGGLEAATRRAADLSGKNIPVEVVTISADGRIVGRS